jgi:hypothetical protein
MPHKVTTVALLEEGTTAVKIAGSCNAIRRRLISLSRANIAASVPFGRYWVRITKVVKRIDAVVQLGKTGLAQTFNLGVRADPWTPSTGA